MSDQSYKILAAQRLAVDPALLLQVLEQGDLVLATTFDGEEHKFTKSDLRRGDPRPSGSPAIPVAEKREKTVKTPADPQDHVVAASIPVAKPKAKK